MKESIVYLLGAGASAGTIPLKQELLREMIPFFSDNGSTGTIEGLTKAYSDRNGVAAPTLDILPEIRHCLQGAAHYGSIDQYLDRVKGSAEQIYLSVALDIYLSIRQSQLPVGPRYRSLISSLFQSAPGSEVYFCPTKVTILSWNFDNQLEMAVRDQVRLPEIALKWAKGEPTERFENPPVLYKINGSSGYLEAAEPRVHEVTALELLLRRSNYDREDTERLAFGLATFAHRSHSRIQFWWDKPAPGWDEALSRISDTETLVIIGYSLHPFNTQKDSQIFSAMPSLKRIIYQVPEDTKSEFFASLTELLKHSGKDPDALQIDYSPPARFFVPRSLVSG